MHEYQISLILREVERIINYRFKVRQLLFEALQSSRNPPPRGEGEPSLALGGQRALEAIRWQLFWAGNYMKDVTLSDTDCVLEVHDELDGDANLVRIANQFRLDVYIGTREVAAVSSKIRAIFGAVWMDSENNLEQVKDVMRVLNLLPDHPVLGVEFYPLLGIEDLTLPVFEEHTRPDT